jgi:hypothetical protein
VTTLLVDRPHQQCLSQTSIVVCRVPISLGSINKSKRCLTFGTLEFAGQEVGPGIYKRTVAMPDHQSRRQGRP